MLQIIFNILIFAAIVVAIILSVRRRSGSAKETRENMETLVRSMRESHEHEMELMRKNYEEQRRDLRDDFNRRIEALKAETASEYRDLSQQILRAESDRLSRQNVDQLGAMLTPFKERLESFRQLVVDSYDKENQARSSLSGQVEQLMKLNQVISREAHDLTTALKGDSKTQGDWGEMVLETLLEQAGLTRDVHFHVQATRDAYGNTLRNEEGNLLRPDVVLHLPDHKDLIVDSKVSLSAFADYCATNDPKEQEVLGRKHLESVKKHIKELADKKYQDYLKNAGDHVLMFMPTENAYLLAIRLDPTLWRYAYENRVAIVSPTHLFSVVQIISQLWKQDDQNRHVIRIAEEGGKLYDKLCTFCVSFEKISTALTQARRSYDDAYKTLATGHGNAISKAMKMREMGAKATKTFPTAIAEDASDDAVDLLH